MNIDVPTFFLRRAVAWFLLREPLAVDFPSLWKEFGDLWAELAKQMHDAEAAEAAESAAAVAVEEELERMET